MIDELHAQVPGKVLPPVGIDLGTTYSSVAYVDQVGQVQTVRMASGESRIPSALLFYGDDVLVGREAVELGVRMPDAFAELFKRDMGERFYSRPVCGQRVPPEVLAAFMLEHLIMSARCVLGPVEEAVITVPAYYDDARRRATIRAAQLAGIRVLDIINEPTAAALMYGHRAATISDAPSGVDRPLRVLVYDLGGGTFDVTVLEIRGQDFRTLATDGDVRLGGIDFDERLANYLAEEIQRRSGVDLRTDPVLCQQLWACAKQAKHALSSHELAPVVLRIENKEVLVEVQRKKFEELIEDLVARTEMTVRLTLRAAGLSAQQIDRVILVGGSTRVPLVQRMIARVFQKPFETGISPDEAVACGAALYAHMLGGDQQQQPWHFTNVSAHTLGVVGRDPQTDQRVVVPLIPRNTPLPASQEKEFQLHRKGQRSVRVKVVEGESRIPDQCIEIGRCVVRDLPPGLPANTRVLVCFEYGTNGVLKVAARIPSLRLAATSEIVRDDQEPERSLAEWRQLLLRGVQSIEVKSSQLPDPNSLATADEVRAALEQLYERVGRAVVREGSFWLALWRVKAEAALAELDRVRREYEQVKEQYRGRDTQVDRIMRTSQQAAYEKQLAEAEQAARTALVRLGKWRARLPFGSKDLNDELKLIRTLRQKLQELQTDQSPESGRKQEQSAAESPGAEKE